jgi:hypothetical protein
MGSSELTETLEGAIRTSLEAITAAHPEETLNGYALCTDDDVRTVYHVACTREFAEASRYRDTRFIPVNWAYDDGDEAFDEANGLVQASDEAASRSADEATWSTHVTTCFESMVAALEQMRQAGLFGEDVLLVVTSTDPGSAQKRLAIAAARRLNPPTLFRDWKAAMFPGVA